MKLTATSVMTLSQRIGVERFNSARKEQIWYISSQGGILSIEEGDEKYNNYNREMLYALKQVRNHLYLGSVNYYGEKRERIASGEDSVYEELEDQVVYNFYCDFAVPNPDQELEQMIRKWNSDEGQNDSSLVCKIMDRIGEIGGINLVWF